ncbi:hypothetical protein F5X99DRAFT_373134 [Biscogniauxia marginata]|nr:hypothetical protein F5X99DRAFT_373134 [Biscogniauxia marginata]
MITCFKGFNLPKRKVMRWVLVSLAACEKVRGSVYIPHNGGQTRSTTPSQKPFPISRFCPNYPFTAYPLIRYLPT